MTLDRRVEELEEENNELKALLKKAKSAYKDIHSLSHHMDLWTKEEYRKDRESRYFDEEFS